MERFALNTLWISVGLVSPLLAIAAPEGGVVESGSATISHSGPHTQVNQASQSAVVGWDQFNVGADESVTFSVPNASSVTLNNIYDQHPSQIMGQVSSNGRLILANPNGLFFGANSQLNVGALVATTSDVELMGDQLTLKGALTSAGIDHQGTVNASGSVAYYAPRIDLSGSVTSGVDIHVSNHTQGTVTLADSGIGFDVADSDEQSLNQQGINVTGTLRSDGGYIGLETAAVNSLYNAALNVEGLVSADSLVSDGGQITLTASEGTTLVSGEISANSETALGGDIRLAGELVELAGEGNVSANGATGGGEIFIGGGWDYTSGPDLARRTVLNENTQVSADATSNGDGGDVWIWSEKQSIVKGGLSAIGVGQDGNGGFVETSSLTQLVVETSPEVGSEFGRGGEWLLDPEYLYIVSSNPGGVPTVNMNSNDDVYTHGSDGSYSYIQVGFLELVLSGGNDVTLRTTDPSSSNSLRVYEPINLGSSATGSLTLDTAGTIYLYEHISATSPDFSLILKAGRRVYIYDSAESIDVGLVDFQTPLVQQDFASYDAQASDLLTIDADSILMQDGLVWNTNNRNLTFSSLSDMNSSDPEGELRFNLGSSTLKTGNFGQSGNEIGAIYFSGFGSGIVFNGEEVTADAINFNGSNTSVTSNKELTISADEVTFAGNTNWSAKDALIIKNDNQTSDINNISSFRLDMGGSNLSFDNITDTSGYNGSLELVDVSNLGIYGTQIKQGAVSIDANEVSSFSSLTVDVPRVDLSNGLSWDADSDLDFTRNTELNSSIVDGGVTFNLDGNNLSFGNVGQGGNGLGSLTVNDVGLLTLRDSIELSGEDSSLDFSANLVSSIQLNGNSSLTTNNGDISLSAIAAGADDPGSGEAPTLSIGSGAGDIELDGLAGIGNVAINSTGAVTASNDMILDGDSLVVDAGQFNVDSSEGSVRIVTGATIDINAPIDSAIGTVSDLSLEAGSRIDIGSVGENHNLGEFQLSTGGTVSLNGGLLFADNLAIDANNLNLTTDTLMSIAGASGQFNETDITGNGGQLLEIRAAGAQVELDAVNVGDLEVEASELILKDSIVTDSGDLDLSRVDGITLAGDTTLNSGITGSLILSNDIAGSYDLSLFVEQGDLLLGSQINSSAVLNSLTLSDASPLVGTNSTTKGITVVEQLDLSNTGVISVGQNASFASESGDVTMTGTFVDATGFSVSISAGDRASLAEVSADSFTLVSDSAVLSDDITASDRLDLSQAGAIRLDDDIRLTGPLLLSTGSASTSVNGNHKLTIDATGQNLTLFDMGNTEALDSLSVVNSGTLQLAGGITTQGLDGIAFSGSRLDLAADTNLNTSSSSGTIDLSGIGVNGDFTLTLNAGSGDIALADLGKDIEIASLVLEDASELRLGGDIRTADALLDLSTVESISLVNDVSIDTTSADGAIQLGETNIDGTFALALETGDGSVQLAEVGQSVSLQSLSLISAADLEVNRDISVIDGLALNGNEIALDSRISSSGGKVDVSSASGVTMSDQAVVDAYGDASLAADSGSIRLGKINSQSGSIDLVAGSGSIYNGLNDFVSLDDTSINLTADRVSLLAGQDIGSGPGDPIVLDVPQAGTIDLSFSAPLAYIVNINQSAVTSNGTVFDVLSDSQRAALSAYSSTDLSGESYPWQVALAEPQPDSNLFAITQPGYTLASNALIEEATLSSDLPAVPNIRLRGGEWWLLYSRNSMQ